MNALKKTGKWIITTFDLLCASRMDSLRGIKK